MLARDEQPVFLLDRGEAGRSRTRAFTDIDPLRLIAS